MREKARKLQKGRDWDRRKAGKGREGWKKKQEGHSGRWERKKVKGRSRMLDFMMVNSEHALNTLPHPLVWLSLPHCDLSCYRSFSSHLFPKPVIIKDFGVHDSQACWAQSNCNIFHSLRTAFCTMFQPLLLSLPFFRHYITNFGMCGFSPCWTKCNNDILHNWCKTFNQSRNPLLVN